jgi:hypothetical protein
MRLVSEIFWDFSSEKLNPQYNFLLENSEIVLPVGKCELFLQ